MFTSLDLLIIVVLAFAAVSILALALMFLVRNKTVRQVCLYVVAALAVYLGYVGFRINTPGFVAQAVFAVLLALAAIAALVIERTRKSENIPLISRIMSAAALVLGMANAFMI